MEALGEPADIETRLFEIIGLEGRDPATEIAYLLSDDNIDLGTIERLIAANFAWGTGKGDAIVANLTAFLVAAPADRRKLLPDIGNLPGHARGRSLQGDCQADCGRTRI